MGPRQSELPPNADLTNVTDLAHNDHTITRDHNDTRTAPSMQQPHPDPHKVPAVGNTACKFVWERFRHEAMEAGSDASVTTPRAATQAGHGRSIWREYLASDSVCAGGLGGGRLQFAIISLCRLGSPWR